jgi:hypothetical protein
VANQAAYPQAGYSVQPMGNIVILYPKANYAKQPPLQTQQAVTPASDPPHIYERLGPH